MTSCPLDLFMLPEWDREIIREDLWHLCGINIIESLHSLVGVHVSTEPMSATLHF